MRSPSLRSVGSVGLVLLLAACWHAMGPGVSGVVERADGVGTHLRLVYLGTGGWILEHDGEVVLAAPLFSNPGFVRTGLAPIESDEKVVDREMGRYDVSGARAILVGHAHYDHLMDVPRVALRHAPRARIVGGRTVANTLGTWSGVGERTDLVEEGAGRRDREGRWHWYGPRVRIMALESHHAPHFDGQTLYQGSREEPLEEEPRWATEWLDGETYAFLIDFMASPDSVAYRVYYQDAVAPPPMGFAPDATIRARPVDVAILVPATFDQVDWHPEAFVENLRPRRILLGHWENFFVPVTEEARSVIATDLEHFEDRLERVFDGEWWRPDRWTEFRFGPLAPQR